MQTSAEIPTERRLVLALLRDLNRLGHFSRFENQTPSQKINIKILKK